MTDASDKARAYDRMAARFSLSPDAPDLRIVRRAADKAALARAHFHATVRDAHAAGASLREIAEAAGLSHETVRKLVA